MEIIKPIKYLYLVPSYKCNLNCDHCFIHLRKEEELPMDEFIKHIESLYNKGSLNDDTLLVIFGGEPLLNKELDKLLEYVKDKKASLSTNMLLFNNDIQNKLLDYNIPIATSWNEFRFNENNYKIWVEKINDYQKYNSLRILITLTDDLITWDIDRFIALTDEWGDNFNIKFEYLIDETKDQEFYDRSNKWLCKLYNSRINKIIDNFNKANYFGFEDRCLHTFTMTPNGSIKLGCPNYTSYNDKLKCLSCELNKFCLGGCAAQKHCTLSNDLYNILTRK